MKFSSIAKTTLTGYSPWDASRIVQGLAENLAPSEFPGDFTFVVEGRDTNDEPCTVMLTSAMSSFQYFYMVDGDRFYHGPNIFTILRESGQPWKWNIRALNSLALMDYVIDGDSLHRDIRRAEAACLYHWGKRGLRTTVDPFPKAIFAQPLARDSEPSHTALHAIMDEICARWPLCLSLSSGFDTRMMLAACLAHGAKPLAGTIGPPEATDVKIASAIARCFGLEHRIVEAQVADYFDVADEVLTLTSGTKTTAHWHTYIFAKKVAFPRDRLHITGANTGISRLVFLDKGIVARAADCVPLPLIRTFFYIKYGPWRKLPGLRANTFLRESDEFPLSAVAGNCARVCKDVPGFLNQIDYFFVFQRERNFIGNGMTLYNAQSPTAAPCADARFLRSVAAMPRWYKLNVRFHREVIQRCVPELLDFPCDETGIPLGAIERPFYWRYKRKSVEYSPIRQFLNHPDVQEILHRSAHLDMFVTQSDREHLIRTQNSQALHFLVTMHFLVEKLKNLRLL